MNKQASLQELAPQIEDDMQAVDFAARTIAQRFPARLEPTPANPALKALDFGEDIVHVQVSYTSDHQPAKVTMDIANGERTEGLSRKVNTIELSEGVLQNVYAYLETPVYREGEGFAQGIGLKRAHVAAGRLAVLRQALESQLEQ